MFASATSAGHSVQCLHRRECLYSIYPNSSGHSNVQATAAVYAHLIPDNLKSAVDMLKT
ncbi:MAG: hypothetical protein LBD73_05455 [Deferribacteraceae bacterium]|nr:hypothetical protein [Deferribacteraceae bacterium]